ncbi:MAG: hypothetical protein WAN43_15975 [Rhodomicrobium sp.]
MLELDILSHKQTREGIAMDPFIQWCENERKQQRAALDRIDKNKLRLFEDDGSGAVDCTEERKKEITRKIAELDELLTHAWGHRHI